MNDRRGVQRGRGRRFSQEPLKEGEHDDRVQFITARTKESDGMQASDVDRDWVEVDASKRDKEARDRRRGRSESSANSLSLSLSG